MSEMIGITTGIYDNSLFGATDKAKTMLVYEQCFGLTDCLGLPKYL